MSTTAAPVRIPAVVKWGKERFTGLSITPGGACDAVRQELYTLTGVCNMTLPVHEGAT